MVKDFVDTVKTMDRSGYDFRKRDLKTNKRKIEGCNMILCPKELDSEARESITSSNHLHPSKNERTNEYQYHFKCYSHNNVHAF